jgi:organic hydroperoxide reductase OsmC/OhrA
MSKEHRYALTTHWTGNLGTGTSFYRAYNRNHIVAIPGKPDIAGSSDQAFLGDNTRYNPEELLLASLSSCHMLWYLHLCAEAGVIVVDYSDNATGVMAELPDGSGRFTEVMLHPLVTVASTEMEADARALHVKANSMCFIANSVNFPVHHQPKCIVAAKGY